MSRPAGAITCLECKWWEVVNGRGICHAHAPVELQQSEYVIGHWALRPMTLPDDWCGDAAKDTTPPV